MQTKASFCAMISPRYGNVFSVYMHMHIVHSLMGHLAPYWLLSKLSALLLIQESEATPLTDESRSSTLLSPTPQQTASSRRHSKQLPGASKHALSIQKCLWFGLTSWSFFWRVLNGALATKTVVGFSFRRLQSVVAASLGTVHTRAASASSLASQGTVPSRMVSGLVSTVCAVVGCAVGSFWALLWAAVQGGIIRSNISWKNK